MGIISTILICFSLSLDNGAIALAAGCGGRLKNKHIFLAGACFVLAHLVMLSVGWFGGEQAGRVLSDYGSWAAFLILLYLGIKMIREGLSGECKACEAATFTQPKNLALVALATSFDALAVGLGLALSGASYILTICAMAFFVFLSTFLGFKLGGKLGAKFGEKMEILGGAVLALMGAQILIKSLLK